MKKLLIAAAGILLNSSGCRSPYPDAAPAFPRYESELVGSQWRAVRTPGGAAVDPGRDDYRIAFVEPDRLTFRADCNQGEGGWESNEEGRIAIGSLFMTRAMCPATPKARAFVADLQHVESYRRRDGTLILELETGERYELEAMNPGAR